MKIPIRVAVMRGGPSNEYDVSMNSGTETLSVLRDHFEDTYKPHDLYIDRTGFWHLDGKPITSADLHGRIDVVFNALHGAYGEDGRVQHILETHGIPFTGSGSLASSLGMNKVLSKRIFMDHGFRTPAGKEVETTDINTHIEDLMHHLYQTFPLPAVVKPVSSGSSVGVSIVRSYRELPAALREAAKHGSSVMIEEYIDGAEATAGVVEGFREQELYALPPIEIRAKTGFFDYDAKYNGQSEEIVPATFSAAIKKDLENLSRAVHKALNLRHYSRTDFIVHPKRGIYVLETNTLPGLTRESLVPKALRAVGSDVPEFVHHVIQLALV